MFELKQLYHELIIDHGRHPRNFGVLENANKIKQGFNPLCGDKVTVYIQQQNQQIQKIIFNGSGCAISMASASLMTEILQGKTIEQATQIFDEVHQLLLGKNCVEENLGKLIVLKGVAEFPARVKCATLAWHTLIGAINNSEESITTELEEMV